MAPFLNDGGLLLISQEQLSAADDSYDDSERVSLWTKEGDFYTPSTNLSILETLDPGVYTVLFPREGPVCKKLDSKSDELFIFSDSVSTKIVGEVTKFWEKADKYKEFNLIHKRGILLEGFPGTGKSSIITLICNDIIKNGGVVFKVSGLRNLVDYIDFITSSFRKIQPDTPVITILEDIDQYVEVELELLDFLDGKTHLNHHVVIATSNNTESIPETFLRPSRIDLRYEIPLPSSNTREEYFKFKGVPDEDIPNLVSSSDNFSLADLKELYICIYVLDYSVEDAVYKITNPQKKQNYLYSPLNASKLGI